MRYIDNITLYEFQKSNGIPVDEQICLIDRSYMHEQFFDWLEYYDSEIKLYFKIIASLFLRRRSVINFLFKGKNVIFLGRKNKSLDDISNDIYSVYRILNIFKATKFALLIGKGDYEFNGNCLKQKPDNLVGICANNINIHHDDVLYLPMGRDFRNSHLFDKFLPVDRKNKLCYCNFSLDTHPVRNNIYNIIKDKKFMTFRHMGNFLNYPISREEFLEELSGSKFCICPRGNALDTFRMWEALYLGVIPIVIREAVFHDQLKDLPIFFLDNTEQLSCLSERYLNEKYKEMLHCTYNYKKLYLNFWIKALQDRLLN